MPDGQLEQLLLQRAPELQPGSEPTAFALPESGEGRFIRALLGGEQAPGDLASLAGATASMLPFGPLGAMKGVRNAFQKAMRRMGRAKPAGGAMPNVVANTANQLDSRLTSLPPSDYKPMVQAATDEDKVYKIMLDRELERRAGGNPPRVKPPRDPRASGMLPGEDPSLRNPERVLPPYREKSGMALDVLEEMKRIPSEQLPEGITPEMWRLFNDPNVSMQDLQNAGIDWGKTKALNRADVMSHLGRFAEDFAPMRMDRRVPYKIGSGVGDYPLEAKNPGRLDWITGRRAADNPINEMKEAALAEDPAGYVGLVRSLDEGNIVPPPMEVELPGGTVFKNPPYVPSKYTNELTQSLADYFAGPDFDPFYTGPAGLKPRLFDEKDRVINTLRDKLNSKTKPKEEDFWYSEDEGGLGLLDEKDLENPLIDHEVMANLADQVDNMSLENQVKLPIEPGSKADIASTMMKRMKETPTKAKRSNKNSDLLKEFDKDAPYQKTPPLLMDGIGDIERYGRPEEYVEAMHKFDTDMTQAVPDSTPDQVDNLFNTGSIDQLTDDLADFFTRPEYDPFGPYSNPKPDPIAPREVQPIGDVYDSDYTARVIEAGWTKGDIQQYAGFLKRLGFDFNTASDLPVALQQQLLKSFEASRRKPR